MIRCSTPADREHWVPGARPPPAPTLPAVAAAGHGPPTTALTTPPSRARRWVPCGEQAASTAGRESSSARRAHRPVVVAQLAARDGHVEEVGLLGVGRAAAGADEALPQQEEVRAVQLVRVPPAPGGAKRRGAGCHRGCWLVAGGLLHLGCCPGVAPGCTASTAITTTRQGSSQAAAALAAPPLHTATHQTLYLGGSS